LTLDEYDRYKREYVPVLRVMYDTMATVPEKLSLVLESVKQGFLGEMLRAIDKSVPELMDFFDKEDTTPFLAGFRATRGET
jgi:hypothetical protein